jgi:hypothetical protein
VWRKVTRTPGLAGAILDTTEREGLDGLAALLADHGLGCLAPP